MEGKFVSSPYKELPSGIYDSHNIFVVSMPGFLLLFECYLFPLQASSFRIAQLKFTTKQYN